MSFCPTKIPFGIFSLPKRNLPYGVNLKTRNSFFLMAEFKKLSGRPQLKVGKRSKKIDARFTEDEYKQIVALEVELGISKTEVVRMCVLNDAGKIVINSKELLKQLDSIGAEMGRVGNNINQLAKHANTMKLQGALTPPVAIKFNDLLEAYIRVQQSLETALRKIIRAMGM
jgi:Bacterial mobilisation protein (MobC)